MFYRKGFRREPNHILGLLKHDIFSKRVDILTKKTGFERAEFSFLLGRINVGIETRKYSF